MKGDFRMLAVFIINNVCTLKCKHCITRTPYQRNPRNFTTATIIRDMRAFFEIFTHCPCEHIDFEGGESLLHPDLHLLVEEAFRLVGQGYSDEVRVLTNCTIIPSRALLDACKKGRFLFILDDYGPDLSIYKDEVAAILEQEQIPYRVDVYHGDQQYCDGWIDLGDFTHKGLSREETEEKIRRCFSAQNHYARNGKIYVCHSQMTEYSHIPLAVGEYIDITDSSTSLEEKRAIARTFRTRPITQCEYCNGFIPDACIRIPAAEQLDCVTPEMRIFGS